MHCSWLLPGGATSAKVGSADPWRGDLLISLKFLLKNLTKVLFLLLSKADPARRRWLRQPKVPWSLLKRSSVRDCSDKNRSVSNHNDYPFLFEVFITKRFPVGHAKLAYSTVESGNPRGGGFIFSAMQSLYFVVCRDVASGKVDQAGVRWPKGWRIRFSTSNHIVLSYKLLNRSARSRMPG